MEQRGKEVIFLFLKIFRTKFYSQIKIIMKISAILHLSIFLLLLQQTLLQSSNYTLVLHSQERGAACLDGTPTGLYYHRGSGKNQNKFMIYFNSGGFCQGFSLSQTLESCYQRSNGNLGSTKKATPTRNFDSEGLLSTQQAINPVFYDWTKIYVIYCDGSEYSGSRTLPISYKDKKLYFRGYNNTLEQFYFLDKQFDFYNGETIVITGVSAGGIATYLYSNYVKQRAKTASVYAIPDSGLFLTEFYSPFAKMETMKVMAGNLFNLIQDEGIGFPIPQCLKQYNNEYYHCYNAVNLAKYQKAPFFIIQSPYDQFSIDNIVYTHCKSNKKPPYSLSNCNSDEINAIEDYRNQTIKAINQIKGSRTDVGAWVPSCVQHGFTDMNSFTDPRIRIPSVDGPMVSVAIAEFLANPSNPKMYIDQVPWPYNTACSGEVERQITRQ